MRKFLVLAAVALSVAVLSAPTASARHTLAHRVKTLETKVNALTKFTNNCLAHDWAPIGWYGDAQNATAGYVYDNDGTGPQAPFFTSALDIAGSPQETTFVVATVNPSCLNQIARRTAGVRREVSGFAAFMKQPPRA